MIGDEQYFKNPDGKSITFQQFRQIENTLACFVGDAVFLRTSSIDSPKKARELYQILQNIHQTLNNSGILRPFRAVSWQLNMPDQEWDDIREQHYCLLIAGNGNSIPHLVLPTDFFLQHPGRPTRSLLLLKTIHKLEMQLNTEGWLFYSDWLNQDMEKVFKTFLPDAADEFQVEANFKDFEHEMTSPLLLNYRKRIDEISLGIGKQEFDDETTENDLGFNELMLLEKELIKVRSEVRANLQFQHKVLEETVLKISKIESQRPELLGLKYSATLLKELLGQKSDAGLNVPMSWIREMFLLTLLEIQLGVISVVNCDSGLDRTGVASAFKLAVCKLSQEGNFVRLMNLALNWDLIINEINKLIIQKGTDEFDSWIREMQGDKGDSNNENAYLVSLLRENVLESLAVFSKLIPHARAHMHEGLSVNKEFLNLIPPYKKSEEIMKPLVNYDPSGAPQNLTHHGFQLLNHYFAYVV